MDSKGKLVPEQHICQFQWQAFYIFNILAAIMARFEEDDDDYGLFAFDQPPSNYDDETKGPFLS